MPGDWREARILEFTSEQGFGKVLVDGAELLFDVSHCVDCVPVSGEPVRVQLRDTPRGVRVAALKSVEPKVPERAPLATSTALKYLHAAGIAKGLTIRAARATLQEVGADDGMLPALEEYYREHPDAAVADGFFACDWRFGNDTDDIFATFSGLAGRPLLVRVAHDEAVERARNELGQVFAFDFADASVLDVTRAFDAELARVGDPRRIFSLDTHGDSYAFLLCDPQAALGLRRLCVLEFDDHGAFPWSASTAFDAAAAAYRAGAYFTGAKGFVALAGPAPWPGGLAMLSQALAYYTLMDDAAAGARALKRALDVLVNASAPDAYVDWARLVRETERFAKRGAGPVPTLGHVSRAT